MHFDIERGEVYVGSRSVKDASLVLHAPPELLTVKRPRHYHVRVEEDGSTEALVVLGDLEYVDERGKSQSVKKRGRVRFNSVRKPGQMEREP